jgi:hypothetical protein
MEPVADIYQRYRLGWFDWAAGIFLVAVPAYAFGDSFDMCGF